MREAAMITEIEDFFARGCGRCPRFATADCSTVLWNAGLLALRGLCLGAGLTETVKWGHPVYTHAGRNLAIIGAFRGEFRLTFFDAALLSDPGGVLERQGPNSWVADAIRFTDAAQVAARAPMIGAWLAEAMAHAAAGRRPPKAEGAPDLPDDLAEALDADPEMAEAFHALTPGRQRGWVIALSSAKTSATRMARIARVRPAILAGRGPHDR
jgi:uncharacterized protein YdeI (YjbR/CyaY-like superfamily)